MNSNIAISTPVTFQANKKSPRRYRDGDILREVREIARLVSVLLFGLWACSSYADSFAYSGSMNGARYGHSVTVLPNGKVLVAGGYDLSVNGFVATAELYDPHSGTWTTTGSMNTARYYHSATLLPGGKVLVAGGFNSGG